MIRFFFSNPVRLIEFILVGLFLLAVITQLVWPLLTDSALFPIFSRKPKIKRQIAQTNEEREEEELLASLEIKQRNLDKLRQSRKSPEPTPDTTQQPKAPKSSIPIRKFSKPQ